MSKCYKCNKSNATIKNNLCQFCKAENIGITKEVLEDLYFKQFMSVIDIANKFNFPISTMYKIFKYFKVDRKKLSLSAKQCNGKRMQTCIDRSGYSHNFNKNCSSRKLWENRLLVEEGITNVFQRKSVKEKALKTFLQKYKKEPWLHKITVRGNGVVSKLNKKVFKILEDNNILFEIEFKIKRPGLKYYSYDIYIKPNKLIEINGDYWHGNPKLYAETDLLLAGSSGEITFKEKKLRDKIKIKFARTKRYRIIVIWEYDLKNNYEKTINKLLKYARS